MAKQSDRTVLIEINNRQAEAAADMIGWKIGGVCAGSRIEGFQFSLDEIGRQCVVAVVKIGGAYTTQMIKTRMPPPPLFHLVDKSPVFRGDILYHPDRDRVGWYCVAEFEPEAGGEDVRR